MFNIGRAAIRNLILGKILLYCVRVIRWPKVEWAHFFDLSRIELRETRPNSYTGVASNRLDEYIFNKIIISKSLIEFAIKSYSASKR
ncbi:hypothetical protein C480_19924 [Natrialba aegyptia DSM 13077]|uniref:Uncharacterized protein n=1 Tax=Natrialba aegyptia DSM 13077 TaxID=1227491 RepID=M0AM21_9EURY|nr:hypothetical protein C480_19924 [Natrialba aegyptia DSM 13077]